MNKRGSNVSKEQMLIGLRCLKAAQSLKSEKLGIPPQEQTAQACLGNDVHGRLAKQIAKLAQREADRCLAEPRQLPDFGYSGSATTASAAETQALGLVADLFGPDLDAAVVLAPWFNPGADPKGARCQEEVLTRTRILLHTLWKQALKAKKNALLGRKDRLTGVGPDAPVESAAQLQDEILAFLSADPQQRVSKAALKLGEKAALKCGDAGVVTPLADMFGGECAGPANPTELATCAEERARCRFCKSLNAIDGLGMDCEDFDNGVADLSCP
jgi:hypothetical protein